jgi:hypothetical protein
MSINRLMSRTCRECGRELTDAVSRRFRTGPDCRKGMTGEQLRAAADLTKEEAKPGYIPPTRQLTIDARMTNAAARRTVQQATTPEVCEHGSLPGRCPMCRRPNDTAHAAAMLAESVARVIARVRAERRAARDGAAL